MNHSELNFPRIWIDADSCPKIVREKTISFTRKNNINVEIFFVANKEIPSDSIEFKMIVCEKEKDSADNYILHNAKKNDLVITKDILFAEKLVANEICVINDRGLKFSKDNIKNLVEDRNFDLQLAEIGFSGTKKRNYTEKNFQKFSKCFETELTKLIKNYKFLIQHQESH